ncbi:unnamed protein product [Paramecium pentaurelia]|uniref:Uncharacterized protein n=1 Tax=Paramecium pentaurelia TaxID=43138 RepID=A0A8S1TAD9_9CILI|nr:unnamed protein product [Paramecium pentaurelia]
MISFAQDLNINLITFTAYGIPCSSITSNTIPNVPEHKYFVITYLSILSPITQWKWHPLLEELPDELLLLDELEEEELLLLPLLLLSVVDLAINLLQIAQITLVWKYHDFYF